MIVLLIPTAPLVAMLGTSGGGDVGYAIALVFIFVVFFAIA